MRQKESKGEEEGMWYLIGSVFFLKFLHEASFSFDVSFQCIDAESMVGSLVA